MRKQTRKIIPGIMMISISLRFAKIVIKEDMLNIKYQENSLTNKNIILWDFLIGGVQNQPLLQTISKMRV